MGPLTSGIAGCHCKFFSTSTCTITRSLSVWFLTLYFDSLPVGGLLMRNAILACEDATGDPLAKPLTALFQGNIEQAVKSALF